MQSLSDISLVAQVAVFHNRRAFDQLVRKYQSPVRRFLLNLTLGNEALSDDLAQDTFIRAYTHITQFQGIASFQTWLFRIAYNVYYDDKRREKGIVKSEKFATANKKVQRSMFNVQCFFVILHAESSASVCRWCSSEHERKVRAA